MTSQRRRDSTPLVVPLLTGMVAVGCSALANTLATADQMQVIQPLIAAAAVFAVFAYLLNRRFPGDVVAEVGFLYLALALAYTFAPALGLLISDFFLPAHVEGFATSPSPAQLGLHFWRHTLFVFGVAVGYLAFRGSSRPVLSGPGRVESARNIRFAINVLLLLIGGAIAGIYYFSAPVETYIDNYVRFRDLSWLSLRFAYVCLIIKSCGYFVLLGLLFSRYCRYKYFIWCFVPLIAVFEVVYSNGARIEALIVLLTTLIMYHCRVRRISIKRCAAILCLLAVLFSVVEGARAAIADEQTVTMERLKERATQVSELSAVYNTGFHLYAERAYRTLPPRDWQMFFFDLSAAIPFINHTRFHPQYWYARNYFPLAPVPPQTMGVIAESGIWGGELDLLIRSIFNGAVFALVARWCRPHLDSWWVLIIYAFIYATSIMTLKYSVLYHLGPLVRGVIPALILTGILLRIRLTGRRATTGTAPPDTLDGDARYGVCPRA